MPFSSFDKRDMRVLRLRHICCVSTSGGPLVVTEPVKHMKADLIFGNGHPQMMPFRNGEGGKRSKRLLFHLDGTMEFTGKIHRI